MLGTAAGEIQITDLAVHPKTHNSFVSVMRGTGRRRQARVVPRRRRRQDRSRGDRNRSKCTSVTLPNPPAAADGGRNNREPVDHRAGVLERPRLGRRAFERGVRVEAVVGGVSVRRRPTPAPASRSTTATTSSSRPARRSTRSSPTRSTTSPTSSARYLCTPLVKFPVSSPDAGAKFLGTTIAELGAGNRPIDMILYQKNGKEFLLMSNTSRGVMKIPTADFGSAPRRSPPRSPTKPAASPTRRSPR